MNSEILAFIPARKGSKGLPSKNTLPLLGHPLIEYTIRNLQRCRYDMRIVVSTDCEKTAEIAISAGAEVPFLRPAVLSDDHSSIEAVLKYTLEQLVANESYEPKIVVYQQINDLFKRSVWIDECVSVLMKRPEIESAFCAFKEHKNYWAKTNDATWERIAHRGYKPRQVKESILREDTGLGCATRPELIHQGRRIGDNVHIVEHEQFSIDIHTEFDFWLAEVILKEREEFREFLLD